METETHEKQGRRGGVVESQLRLFQASIGITHCRDRAQLGSQLSRWGLLGGGIMNIG